MIETTCQCGATFAAPESSVGTSQQCTQCGAAICIVAAEQLPEGAGAGDFDAHLHVTSGPSRIGEQLLLGGVAEISVGKLPDRTITLPGNRVSRSHCKITRIDFGPSRWELTDNNSTNGVLVNGQRVASRELRDGDTIQIGEYTLKFSSTFERDQRAAQAAATKAAIASGAAMCPSCSKILPAGARICVNCGVDVKTGRSLVVSKGLDEDDLAIRADTWIRTLSWIIPFGLFPIASEAFGTRKPLTTWVLFTATTIASILFTITLHAQGEDASPAVLNLLQWNGDPQVVDPELAALLNEIEDAMAEERARQPAGRQPFPAPMAEPPVPAEEPEIGFRWYQLFTSAMLHDPDLIMPFIYHLGGNMLFLLVFGLRVNELIGNWRMSIAYPLLAVVSGLAHHLATMHTMVHPSLGASGAVMGLAGMYFVFFPAQRVHMAIWFRGGILTRWQCFYKVFRMRGFWLLVMWIGMNDVLPMFIGLSDNVAHWAHVGGFLSGVVLALILLLSRQVSALGGDILSVALGRRAWALVGRPADHVASV